ncbi:MAG: choice-of-anchor D domain-containing protein [Candidatus Omnitrophica bacterium]|nr:choice-of-anchor D domain-containing protein [Candidatus Omnitrophota bacterium]
MHFAHRSSFLLGLFVFIAFLSTIFAPATFADPPSAKLIRKAAPFQRTAPELGEVRSRAVELNLDALPGDIPESHPVHGYIRKVEITLFEDVVLTLLLYPSERKGPDHIAWQGYVESDPTSTVFIVRNKASVTGIISTVGTSYEIRFLGNGLHRILEVNYSALPPEAKPHTHDEGDASGGEAPTGETASADSGGVTDLLVVYTPAARATLGGTDAMNSRISLFVTQTNTALANSQVTTRMNLVHTAEVSYVESGSFSTDLSRLRGSTDGYMDTVHEMRNLYGADLVSLILNSGDYCGTGYLPKSLSTGNSSLGFSVVLRNCTDYTFAHELGHNMGSHHDRANAGGTPLFPYAYGWRFYGNSGTLFRTVMAYSPGRRIPYFSNPNLLYDGTPTGVPDSEDNARSLNQFVPYFSNYRTSTTPVLEPVLSFSPVDLQFGNLAIGGSKRLILTLSNKGGADLTVTNIQLAHTEFALANPENCIKTLAPFESCSLSVDYLPFDSGSDTGVITFTSNDPTGPHGYYLFGTGVAAEPDIMLSATGISFGNVKAGSSQTRSLSISNTGSVDLLLNRLEIVNNATGAFQIASDGCSSRVIAPAGSCTVSIRFSPLASTSYSADLVIESNDPDESSLAVPLSGQVRGARGKK